ncbi:non-homologous end-joining factor 1-like [Osmia bicornis bicornis]|uniref:non-homologous end-joining factor 1-like n=1 Tax=Osmia bicornis bicornis TaxID=1437191 RepID=UPI0010F43932|nr:non-homologous end-joining factor 1-like [Osmia bicornis bicornis]
MDFPQSNKGLVWNKLKINDEVYMISATQKDDTIEILLTNFIQIWIEKFTDKISLDRCRELNPLLNVEALNCKEIILNILSDIPKHIVEASPEQIKLRVKLEGGFMKFALNLIKGTPEDFWKFVTKPLCISSMEIIRQHKFLLDLVKKKDEEIAEYKAEGAELIRKNIETKPFMEEQLRTVISSANTDDYTNMFQTITNFYNAHLQKHNESSVKSSDDKVKEEQNISSQDGAEPSEGVISEGSTPIKTKTSPSKSKKQKKNTDNDEEIINKTRNANMAYRPTKKLKKGVPSSIL